MATEAEMFEQGGRMVRDAGTQVLQQSGGLFSGIWDAVKSTIKAPFNLIGGMAKSTVGGVLSYGLKIGAVVMGAGLIAPDLVRGAGELIKNTGFSDKIGADIDEGGVPALAMKAIGAGVIGGGAIGAVSGAFKSITGGVAEGEEAPSAGSRIGSAFGTVATVGILAVLGTEFFKNGGVSHDAKGGDRVEAPAMPKPAAQTQQALDA